MTPGRALAFVSRSTLAAEIVTVRRALVGDVAGRTFVWWDTTGVGVPPPGGWTLDDLLVHGNVARVSHGRTVEEVLGGSDGAPPSNGSASKEAPVTVLTGAMGGKPALVVRVDGVRWTRVPDLARSGPDDRHYRSETDDRGTTTVVFGDGSNGAVPPSGKKKVTASYRVGLGPEADVGAGRLSRVKRGHPLVNRVSNATPILGGTAPAGIDDMRAGAPVDPHVRLGGLSVGPRRPCAHHPRHRPLRGPMGPGHRGRAGGRHRGGRCCRPCSNGAPGPSTPGAT